MPRNCERSKRQVVMREFHKRKLRSGRGGAVVTNPRQAVAIAYSVARKYCSSRTRRSRRQRRSRRRSRR